VRRRKSFKSEWVKLPSHWINALAQSNSPATLKLAHTILAEAFKRKHIGGKVILSSEVTKMPRNTRTRAAKELVELGLITIKKWGNQALEVSDVNYY
jgi:Fic family protein